MKRKTYILLSLTLIAMIGGLTIWNFSANRVSAQKAEIDENLGVVNVANEYNARNEFALTQGGTTGVWRYGYTTTDASNTFVSYTLTRSTTACGSPANGWIFSNAGDTTPVLYRVDSPATCNGTPPDSLFVHPGAGGERVVLRWVAPAAGTYQLTGVLQRADPLATTDLRILKNETTSLFTGSLNSQFQQAFNFTVTVAANDTIDFSVGYGNGTYNSDGSSLNVVVSQPVTACLTAPANLQINVPAENSPADVQSVNTNASLVGDAAYTNTGKVGRAFELDGNGDYVRIEDNAAQRPATAVTAEGWFKFDSTGGIASLISKPVRSSPFNSYTLYLESGQLRGLIGNASQYTRALSSFSPQTGVWHHLAFTYDYTGGVSTLKLYANGVDVTSSVDGTANLPLFYDANPFPLLIGGEFENNAPAFFLDGQADEVSVYGRALAQTEIFDIVQAGSYGKCAPGSACVSAPQGLVAWYKGENNALDSNSRNPGTLQNGAAFAGGKVGQAFSLDGSNDYVSTADSADWDFGTNDFAIEGWFNSPNPTDVRRIISAGSQADGANNLWSFGYGDIPVWGGGQRLNFAVFNGGGYSDFSSNPVTFNPNTWHHAAVVRSGTSLTFYLDGAAIGTVAIGAGFAVNGGSTGAIIGARYNNNPSTIFEFANGRLDEISVYKRALSAAEISSVYNAAGNGKCLNYVCAQPPNNLVSWFAGEGNALDSKSSNHGTLQNGTTFQTAKVGQGFKFDGVNDFVEIPDNASLKPATLTLETWVKFDSLTSTVTGGAPAGYQNIIFKKNSRAAGTGFEGGYSLVKNPDNRIGIGFNSAGGATDFASSTTFVQAGVWYHIVGTHDGTNIRLYINGQLEGTGTATFPIDYGTTPLYLGNAQVPFSGYFNGVLDETTIYDRALTAMEVSSIYNANSSGKCKPVATNPAANQIAWLTGDGDTRDFLGANPNGILRGNANFRVGKVGQAFNLDGSGDYVEIADDADHRPANDLTVEGWFNVRSISDSHFVSKPIVGTNSNSYVVWYDGGAMRAGHGDQFSNFETLSTTFSPNLNTWYHFAYTIDDANNVHRFYINGTQIASAASTLPLFYDANPHPLLIGAEYGPPGTPYSFVDGRMDEISLYSRALSANEIAAIYNAGAAGKLKSAVTPVNLSRNAKTAASLAPTTVQLSSATVTFAQVTSAGTTSQSGIDLGLLPPLPSNFISTGLAYDISTTAAYQNGSSDDVQVCFSLPALTGVPNLRILHLENNVWVNRTAAGGSASNLCTDNLTSLSPFVIVQSLAPTAANVSVAGRVSDAFGSGLGGVIVTLTDSQGRNVTTRTNNFGRYTFNGVSAGDVYIVSVASKRYEFAVSTQAVSVMDAVENVDFTASQTSLLNSGKPEVK